MMLKLHGSDDDLYARLAARDPALEGQVFACVATTGIFCHLSCPARTPLRRNVGFRGSIAACLEAGFRPCKRCRPTEPRGDAVLAGLIRAQESDPERRWAEADLRALGHDPRGVARASLRALGISFLDLARLRRGLVRDDDAGARAAVDALIGGCAAQGGLAARWIATPLGEMLAIAGPGGLHLLEFAGRGALLREIKALQSESGGRIGYGDAPLIDRLQDELGRYFTGQGRGFSVPVAPIGTPFQRRVWDMLRTIPPGATWSYADLARALDQPTATRAVAAANGANPVSILVPCHRVIGKDGSLTGYGGGLWRKRWLLDLERAGPGGATG